MNAIISATCTWNRGTAFQEWCTEKPTHAMWDGTGPEATCFAFLCAAHKDQAVGALDKSHVPYRVSGIDEIPTANIILPEKEGDAALFIHPVSQDFREGDEVIDRTAEANGWPDVNGVVEEVDGSNIKVKYTSGTSRWKIHINLRKP